jgi:hypothetical protein
LGLMNPRLERMVEERLVKRSQGRRSYRGRMDWFWVSFETLMAG